MSLQVLRINCLLACRSVKFCSPALLLRSTSTNVPKTSTLQGYTTIYKFPHIRFVASLSRLKLAQTIITVMAVPASATLVSLGHVPQETYTMCFGVCALALGMLYTISAFTRRTVGFMYLDQTQTRLRVAYLNFWGSRRDIDIPVSDVVPLSDLQIKLDDVYVKLCRYSTSEALLFTLRYGTVLDRDKFEKVFGSLGTS